MNLSRSFPWIVLLWIGASSMATAQPPNIVFILIDDLGFGDLGCYGSRFHETPNLDRLASEGMRFTQAYSACTVCSPSRAAIMTGQSPARLHLTDWIAGHQRDNAKLLIPDWTMKMEHSIVTLPEALKEIGYQTHFIGKWHLMPNGQSDFDQHKPEDHGFDTNVGGREWGQPKGRGKYFSPFDMPNLSDGQPGDYLTDALTDAATEKIDRSSSPPYFLFLSHYTVHNPLMAPESLVQKYKTKAKTFQNDQDEYLNPVYAAMMESLDQGIGRVLDAIDETKEQDNTIVVFTGDNGGVSPKSSGGLRGSKGFAYEGGTREPLLIRWPGKIEANSTCDVPVIGMDFYPTLMELIGQESRNEQHLDGVSLAPLLLGNQTSLDRDTLHWHYPHYHNTLPYGSIRSGDWKLIEYFEDGRQELYDLNADPQETNDVAARNPDVVKRLQDQMRQWRRDVKAQMPTRNPNFKTSVKGAGS